MLDRLVPAFSILVSILLAFAIDAWWEDAQERERYLDQLSAVRFELEETRDDLEWQRETLLRNRDAIAWILERTAPEPADVSFDDLSRSIDQIFRGFALESQTGALRALMASGVIGHVQNLELMSLLSDWPTLVAEARSQTQMLLLNREEIIRYLQPRVPTNAIGIHTGQMAAYPVTSFPGDSSVLLREMEFEGLIGNRGMLVEDSLSMIIELDAKAAEILVLIEQEF